MPAPSPASRAAEGGGLHRLSSIVVLGDSVAHGAGDETGRGGIAGYLGAWNAGINGARTWNVIALLGQPAMRKALASAEGVVLSIGGNDLYGDKTARLVSMIAPGFAMRLTMMRVSHIVARLEKSNPRLRVYILGLYDPYRRGELDVAVAEWNGMLMRRFAEDARVTVVPIADLFGPAGRLSPIDHFHPSGDAYERIARRIRDDYFP
jgi:lysophospholipase L1-like esterase